MGFESRVFFFFFFFLGGGEGVGVLSIAEGSFLPYNDDLRMTKCNINHINFTNQKHIHCL